MGTKLSTSKYAEMSYKIRELYSENSSLIHGIDDWSINHFYPNKSGDIEFVFYWHDLWEIRTKDGCFLPVGSIVPDKYNSYEIIQFKLIDYFGLILISDIYDEDVKSPRCGERWIIYKATKNIPE